MPKFITLDDMRINIDSIAYYSKTNRHITIYFNSDRTIETTSSLEELDALIWKAARIK